MFDAVLFDLDGLLVDTEALLHQADLDLFAEIGVPKEVAAPFLAEITGTVAAVIWERIAETFPQADVPAMKARRAALVDAAYAAGIPVIAGIPDVLDALDARGIPYAVATNSERDRALYKLTRTDLLERVQAVVAYDDVAAPKPAPDVYLAAARALGVAPDRCLAFDDSDTGVQAARAAGCCVVQVPNMQATDGRHAHFLARTVAEGARMAGLDLFLATKEA